MLRSKAAIAAKKPSDKKLFPVFFYGVGEAGCLSAKGVLW